MRLKTMFPAGACKGTTKEGKRCGIRDVYENGLCKWHGGEGMLVRDRRFIERQEHRRKRQQIKDRKFERMLSKTPAGRELLARIKARQHDRERRRADLRSQDQERHSEVSGDAAPVGGHSLPLQGTT